MDNVDNVDNALQGTYSQHINNIIKISISQKRKQEKRKRSQEEERRGGKIYVLSSLLVPCSLVRL